MTQKKLSVSFSSTQVLHINIFHEFSLQEIQKF